MYLLINFIKNCKTVLSLVATLKHCNVTCEIWDAHTHCRDSEVPTQDMLFPIPDWYFLQKNAIEMFITMYLTYKKIPIGQHVQ